MKSPVLAALVRILTGASVRWVNCAPDPRQRVYFANHTSHLDALVLWAALPGEVRELTRPVAARDYWETGHVRHYLASTAFHAILIERANVTKQSNPLDLILKAIEDRYSAILFPEGGRGQGPDVGEFKCGLYHMRRARPDLEFVPVYIENLNRILPKGEFLPVPVLSSVTFGPPVQFVENEPKPLFLRRAREAVCSLKRW